LTGNWQPNAIRQNVDMVGAGVEVPMLPEAKALYDKRKAALGREDPEARCLPPGVPRMSTTPYPWSFIQTPKEIVIVYEGGAHIWRKIFLDGRKHDPKVEQTWLGDSVGHWEGDTLVVDTVGQNDITWIDAAGIPHSTDMKVTSATWRSSTPSTTPRRSRARGRSRRSRRSCGASSSNTSARRTTRTSSTSSASSREARVTAGGR
jgi:hypothetical protein